MTEPSPTGNFHPEDAPGYESILQCMRCGFCLAVCPTYALTNRERSSPRGRAALARAVAEGKLEFTPAVRDEAVPLPRLQGLLHGLSVRRPRRNDHGVLPEPGAGFPPPSLPAGMLRDFILKRMLPSPALMETSMLPARLYQRLGLQWAVRHLGINRFLPGVLDKMEGILPTLGPPLRTGNPAVYPRPG